MVSYINGVIVEVGAPVDVIGADGRPVLDRSGMAMKSQTVILQHEWKTQEGYGADRYVKVSVRSTSSLDRISSFALCEGENIELGIVLNASFSQNHCAWFNNDIQCVSVERDQSRWHRPVTTREAVIPEAVRASRAAKSQANKASAPSYPPSQTPVQGASASASPSPYQSSGLPFPPAGQGDPFPPYQ